MMEDTRQPHRRVLFLLDEIGQLGKLDPLLQAMTLGRGYGLDVWTLWQDVSQIKGAYGERWKTFFANSVYQQFFGVRDLETATYVSETLGTTTIQDVSYTDSRTDSRGTSSSNSSSYGSGNGSSGSSYGGNRSQSATQSATIAQMGRALLTPDEILRLDERDILILMANRAPVRGKKYDIRNEGLRYVLEQPLLLASELMPELPQPSVTTSLLSRQ